MLRSAAVRGGWRAAAWVSILMLVASGGLVVGAGPASAAPTAFVIFQSGNAHLGRIDLATGTVTDVGSTGLAAGSVTGVALAPSGTLYAVDTTAGNLLTLNPATGAVLTTVAITGASPANVGLTVTSDGRLFMSSGNAFDQLNPATGVATLRATFASGVTGLAARCVDLAGDNQIFAIAPGINQVFRVDPTTFSITTLSSPVGVPMNSPKLGFDASGILWAANVFVTPTIFQINATTGAGTNTGSSTSTASFGLAITATACAALPPSPASPSPATVVAPRFTG